MTDPITAALRTKGTVREFPSGSYLFFEGDGSGSVLLIESGLVRIERSTADGRTALLDLAVEGNLVGELGVIDEQPRSATAVTIEPSRIRSVDAEDFRRTVAADPEIASALLHRVVHRLRKLTDQFVNVANRSGTERVADRLIELLDRSGEPSNPGVVLHMPITQAELGQWAGLSREGTTNALADLRKSGIISTGRRTIVIERPDKLRKLVSGA